MPRLRARSSSTWKIRQSLPAMSSPAVRGEILPKALLERREERTDREALAEEPVHGIAAAADRAERRPDREARRVEAARDARPRERRRDGRAGGRPHRVGRREE